MKAIIKFSALAFAVFTVTPSFSNIPNEGSELSISDIFETSKEVKLEMVQNDGHLLVNDINQDFLKERFDVSNYTELIDSQSSPSSDDEINFNNTCSMSSSDWQAYAYAIRSSTYGTMKGAGQAYNPIIPNIIIMIDPSSPCIGMAVSIVRGQSPINALGM